MRFFAACGRFLRRLLRLLRSASGSPSTPPTVPPPDDYLDLLKKHPGTRVTTVTLLDPIIAGKGTLSRHEHIETEDDDGNLRQIDAYHAATCPSCGRILGKETQPAGVCKLCDTVLCASCHERCSACQLSACPRHRKTFVRPGGENVTYCLNCAWRHYWRLWWGLY